MELSTLTSKGQMTIPASIRRSLALNTGDRLKCYVEEDKLVIVPAKTSLKSLKGIVPKPERPISIEDMNEAILDEAQKRSS